MRYPGNNGFSFALTLSVAVFFLVKVQSMFLPFLTHSFSHLLHLHECMHGLLFYDDAFRYAHVQLHLHPTRVRVLQVFIQFSLIIFSTNLYLEFVWTIRGGTRKGLGDARAP